MGADVAYMFADSIDDGSTATSAVILQVVPVKYQLLGSLNQIKGYMEDATNATAGCICCDPSVGGDTLNRYLILPLLFLRPHLRAFYI